MNWTCTNCGNPRPVKTVSGTGWERCDQCSDMRGASVPDVYWDGKEEHGLADDPVTGKPRVFGSKAEKAAYLKERGLSEAGDRVHGSFVTAAQREQAAKANERESVLRALQKVRQMGADVRRQAYLKIVSENGRR